MTLVALLFCFKGSNSHRYKKKMHKLVEDKVLQAQLPGAAKQNLAKTARAKLRLRAGTFPVSLASRDRARHSARARRLERIGLAREQLLSHDDEPPAGEDWIGHVHWYIMHSCVIDTNRH